MSTRGLKYTFIVGELVLCFEPDPTKAKVLYDAKVLDLQSLKDKDGKKIPGYHIHFQGWNSSWDRIVSEEFILKSTDENRLLMKKLAETAKKNQSKGNRTRKIDEILKKFDNEELSDDNGHDDDNSSKLDDGHYDDDVSSENSDNDLKESPDSVPDYPQPPKQPTHDPVEVILPDRIKQRLEDDYYLIHYKDKLLKLPVQPNVIDILESFVKNYCFNLLSDPGEREKSRSNSSDSWNHAPGRWIPLCKEMVDGIRICFDFTLPILLLYNDEKDQYKRICKTITPQILHQESQSYEPERKKSKIQSPTRSSQHDSDSDSSDDLSIRRITRRSIHEETPKSHPRGRKTGARSKRTVSSPPTVEIKTEPGSDNEISFNLNVQSCNQNIFNAPPTSSNGNGFHPHDDHRSEMIDSLLSWKLLPSGVQSESQIQPSQIYGIHHLLRLFVKFPSLVNKMNIDQPRTDILMKLVDSFLQYVVEREDLFQEDYYMDS
ncbi:hypothetical protein LOTGIDRAFT_165646 [Lottia gigantea]|uniref:Uncharacterized protein n=1 Tax=Lottia gigantea TaxID=225164 RepID=V4A5H4_LOTGI|nr:hypothetical protein LOTGIDRAFT_165646 [Lottia gigantea]ESO88506.1 hypothetical protein LOTGIDRAFT_165646 [Lottia gigantea]